MPLATMSVRIRDFSDEYTTATFYVDDLEFVGGWADAVTMATALETALAGAILGTIVSINFSQEPVGNEDTRPASGEAQREKGLRLFYHDDVSNRKGNVTLGTADFGALAQPGTDIVPLDHAEVAPIVAWIEANVQIEEGNSVTVDRAVLVGRSS